MTGVFAKEPWRDRLWDAALAALVAALLGIPFIGLTTVDTGGRLLVHNRWDWLAITVAVVFPGRLLLRWLLQFRQTPSAMTASVASVGAGRRSQRWLQGLGGLAFAVALAVPLIFYDNRYVVDTATTVLIYVLLGWGLNVVVGLAGLLDLGYVAFYAAGAYTYAVLATQFGVSFWVCLPVAMAVAAVLGVLLGYPVLRLRGDYLAIVTLGFGEIIRLVLLNWTQLTGGPNGIASIPRPTLFGLAFSPSTQTPTVARFFDIPFASWHRTVFLYGLILTLALFANWLILRLRRLPIGRAWEAMREDEIAARALGLNVTNVKLSAFAIGATLGGLAGVFFAARQGFVSPESFTFVESAIILSIVVLGGSGSQLGVVLAATVLVLLPEIGRNFSEYRMMVFGAAMVAIMVWRPGGLLAQRCVTVSATAAAGSRL